MTPRMDLRPIEGALVGDDKHKVVRTIAFSEANCPLKEKFLKKLDKQWREAELMAAREGIDPETVYKREFTPAQRLVMRRKRKLKKS